MVIFFRILPIMLILCAFAAYASGKVTIRQVVPLSDNCVMVYGSVALGGNSFFLKDCVASLTTVGTFDLGFLEQLRFTSSNTAWAISGGNIVRLGVKNHEIDVDIVRQRTDKEFFNSVHFVDNSGVAVGKRGLIVTTSDGGSSWEAVKSNSKANLKYVDFLDSQFGWILGESRSGRGLDELHVTYDGGRTWVPIKTGGRSFGSFVFRSRNEGCGILSRKRVACVRLSEDWVDIGLPEEDRNGLFFSNENVGWLVGSSIARSLDGGRTWTAVMSPTRDLLNLDALIFVGDRAAWAWGVRELLVSKDGGITWTNRFTEVEKLVLSHDAVVNRVP